MGKIICGYFMCDCGCGILHIDFDGDTLDLALYKHTSYMNRSWRYRLRQIWKIIRTGEPYSDELVLNEEKTKNLIEFLKNLKWNKIT